MAPRHELEGFAGQRLACYKTERPPSLTHPMPTSTHTTPGQYISTELMDAKRKGESFTQPQLAARIDVLLETWNQVNACPRAECLAPAEPVKIDAEAIYQAYPRKIGKKAALKAITTAISADTIAGTGAEGKANTAARLLKATKAYASAVAAWPAKDREYVPHPSTWFNRGSYLDDPKEWQRDHPSSFNATARDYSKI